MWIALVTVTPIVAFFGSELLLRIFVSRRIQEFIENVPPLGIVQSSVSRPSVTLQVPTQHQTLEAICFYPQRPVRAVVIYSPELHGSRDGALRYCEALLDQGFAVLGLDFRSDSQSPDAPNQWVTESDVNDLLAAVNWVAQSADFRSLPIGLFGVSRSGAAAITAAWQSPAVSAVITESAFTGMQLTLSFVSRFGKLILPEPIMKRLPGWHIRAALRMAFRRSERDRATTYVHLETTPKPTPTPTLLISGKRDSYVGPKVTAALAEILGPSQTETWIVPKAKHNRARLASPEEYDQRLARFYCEAFGISYEANPDSLPSSYVA